MKKTIKCVRFLRRAFARIYGRMSSMDAPVVPIRLAITAPTVRYAVLTNGVPAQEPRILIPPEITNNAVKSAMNEKYSVMECSSIAILECRISTNSTGMETAMLKNSLFRLLCQMPGIASGRTAIDNSMTTNGATLHNGKITKTPFFRIFAGIILRFFQLRNR